MGLRFLPGQVSALLMSGAHVNIADEKGRTPLHIAAELGDPVLSDRVLIGGFNVLTCVGPYLRLPVSCAHPFRACLLSPMRLGLIPLASQEHRVPRCAR